jgi:putative flippase GtrA
MNPILPRQFIRFLVANTFAALVNIITRLLGSLFLLDGWAVVAGFCAGLSTSYILCRRYVFRSNATPPTWAEVLRFVVINLFALLLTWAVYRFTLQGILSFTRSVSPDQWMRTAAHTIGVAAPVFFSFAAQKTFTFRQRI